MPDGHLPCSERDWNSTVQKPSALRRVMMPVDVVPRDSFATVLTWQQMILWANLVYSWSSPQCRSPPGGFITFLFGIVDTDTQRRRVAPSILRRKQPRQ